MLKIGYAGYEYLSLADAFVELGINAEYLAGVSYYSGQLEEPPKRSLQTFNLILKEKNMELTPTNYSISLGSLGDYHGIIKIV